MMEFDAIDAVFGISWVWITLITWGLAIVGMGFSFFGSLYFLSNHSAVSYLRPTRTLPRGLRKVQHADEGPFEGSRVPAHWTTSEEAPQNPQVSAKQYGVVHCLAGSLWVHVAAAGKGRDSYPLHVRLQARQNTVIPPGRAFRVENLSSPASSLQIAFELFE